MLAIINKLTIDLVRNQPEIMSAAQSRYGRQFLPRIHRASRVIGRCQKDRASARPHSRFHLIDQRMELVFGWRADSYNLGASSGNSARVSEIHRFWHQNLVTRLQKTQGRTEQGVLRTDGDNHLICSIVCPVFRA